MKAMFGIYRLTDNLTNMEFKMHSSGLHYYKPTHKDFTFVNTVDDNKKAFSKRQLKGAELARTLYATLGYPSIKDFKWVIQSNQINTTFWEPHMGLVPCVVVKCPCTTDGTPHPWLMLTSLCFTYSVPTIICHAG